MELSLPSLTSLKWPLRAYQTSSLRPSRRDVDSLLLLQILMLTRTWPQAVFGKRTSQTLHQAGLGHTPNLASYLPNWPLRALPAA